MVIKETEYRGILFRSRLEARVAFFFDKAGIEWIYEPDRCVNGDSEYNPDFYLPKLDDYVEVKGKRPGYEKEILKAKKHIVWGGEIKKLVIISEIPDPTSPGLPHFPCFFFDVRAKDGVGIGYYYFFDDCELIKGSNPPQFRKSVKGYVSGRRDYKNWFMPEIEKIDISPITDFRLSFLDDYDLDKVMKEYNSRTFKAYAAARKADFTMRRAG